MPHEELEVDGLAVLRFRPDDPRATVVVVHGAMDRSSGFRRTARRLPDLEVVLFDRRGYAGSLDAGTSPTIADQLADLRSVIEATSDGPVTVVGHSVGGLLALHLAVEHPELVASLATWEPPLPWLDWYVSAVVDGARSKAFSDDPDEAAEHFMRGMIGDRLWERLPAATRAERRSEGPALVVDMDLGRHPDAEVDLAAVRVPTVAGCGELSAPRFRRAARYVMDHVPDAMLVEVAEAEHGVHLSHPPEFAAFIQAGVARAH